MDLGRSISNFGNSLSGAAYQIANANYQAQNTKNEIESTLALTKLKENIFNNFQDKNANWDIKDEEGNSMYKGYLENFETEQEELWEELSKGFTNPGAADKFYPVFSEYISASRMDLDEMVTNYSQTEDKSTAVDTLNRLSVMPGDSIEERNANINAFINKGVDEGGVFTAAEGKAYKESALAASNFYEVERIAGKALSEMGFDAAKTVIQGSDLIGDEDKKKLLDKYEDENNYQKKLREDIHQGRREDQKTNFGENIDTGKLRNVDRLYELSKVTGKDLESGDLKSMAALIRQLDREDEAAAKGEELSTSKIVTNQIATMRHEPNLYSRTDILDCLEEALDSGDMLEKDYTAIKNSLDSENFRWLNDSATKRVIAEIEESAKGKDAVITEAESVELIDEYYNWNTHNAWSEKRFLDDTEFSDIDKLQWLENRLNPYKAKKIDSSIRSLFADNWRLSGNEKFQLALEEGQGLGIFQADMIASELSFPEIREPGAFRNDLSLSLYSVPYDRLNNNQKEIIQTNEKMVSHIKAQKNDLKDFADIDNPEIRLNDRGEPIFKDSNNDFYKVVIENKDEVWKKWVWIDKETGKGVWDTLSSKKEVEEVKKENAVAKPVDTNILKSLNINIPGAR